MKHYRHVRWEKKRNNFYDEKIRLLTVKYQQILYMLINKVSKSI